MRKLLILICFTICLGVAMNVYAQAIPNSTKSNEVLKLLLPRLNLQGEWITLRFADGTEMSTSAGGMSAATYDPQAIAGDAFDLALHTGDIAGVTPPYIAQTSGTGTGNVLTNTTLDGTGTISANVSLSGNITANSLLITPTELSYINNVSSEIQSQITTATGSITNHVHSGSDGTIQIAHDSITGTGTNSHATLDTFITSKAQASGLASLDGSSLVVQNPANSTATPEASKILIADGSGKIADGWLSTNVSLLGQTIAHDSITGTGTNSHATIDTHLANTTDPHGSTLTQTSATIAGVDAPYIAQANGTGTGNTLTGLTVNGVTGLVDSDVPNTITLDNITQITNRSHTSLSDIGTNAHTAIDSHIDDTIDPHGVTLTQTAATIAGVTAPYIAQTSGTGTGLTLAGDTNFPSGIWNSSGNVGIGMGAIAGKLCVNGQVRIYDGQVSYYTGSAQQYALAPYKFIYGTGTDESLTLFAETGNSIYFATGGVVPKKMVIDTAGNVGIGAAAPGAKLHIKGTDGLLFFPDYAGLQEIPTSFNIYSTGHGISVLPVETDGQGVTLNYHGSDGSYYSALEYVNPASGTYSNLLLMKSGGNVGIGTSTPSGLLHLSKAGGFSEYHEAASSGAVSSFFKGYSSNTDPIGLSGGTNLFLRNLNSTSNNYSQIIFVDSSDYNIAGLVGINTNHSTHTGDLAFFTRAAGGQAETMRITSNGNVGIGTTTPNNILTLPIASGTDPIADAWTNHCLADYKDIGTETTEMIQLSANDKIKTVPVSSFTKKAIISDDEAEREIKQKYQDRIRESAKADLELYTAETGVAMNNNSYVDELVNSMWETKADRLTIVEANKQKLIAEKKALPKFQRQQYGIVAEDAPPEAQVLREDGSLQGVDPYPLIGILWANAQKQDERIALLETQIADLSARVLALEGR